MTNLYGFELLEERDIPELKVHARLWRHQKTGAQLLSMENDDENKVFGITFRTPPSDSTGVAHIMEHSVLCGSRKYPVKEPYVELVKGSLRTYVNALTFPDKTTYPVASTNTQDFYNLVDVYLDAVFFPLLTRHTMEQEGWHYELENPDDPLTIKGVVFNEMKGAYSSPDGVLGELSQQVLFPENTYGFDSGGDPRHIPDLTYEQFKQFHDVFYHPANARIYFYGDDDPETRLKLLDEYLREFEPLTVNSAIPLHPKFRAPKKVVRAYAANADSDGNNKTMFTVNWLLPETKNVDAATALGLLSYILVGTPASPLRKALIDSGLGEDITGGGTSSYLRQMFFSVGLKGVADENVAKAEQLIYDTLTDLAKDGIDADMIEAGLNTLEFRLREQNTGSYPRGLALMFGALSAWLYDGDPLKPLAFEKPLAKIKENAQNPDFFPSLIREHLLDNSHRVTLILRPDSEKNARDEAEERERLAQIKAKMSQQEIIAIIENTRLLKKIQETPDPPEALATIPHLTLADLDKKNKTIPISVDTEQGSTLLYHDLFTNGIVYLDVGMNLRVLPQEYLPYLPLFSEALLEIGTEKEDFVKLSQRIGRKTGGIWSSTYISARDGQMEDPVAWLMVRGKATMSHIDDLLDILRDVLLSVKFDNLERFRQMVLEDKADQEAGLIPGGHSVVNGRLRAHFNTADWVSEQLDGISNLFFVRRLVDEIENDWDGILQKLETMRHLLLNRNAMLCNVTLDADNWTQFRPKLAAFLGDLPAEPVSLATWQRVPLPPNEGLTIPAQVNYVAKGANIYKLGYRYHGSIAVINNYIRSTWLWERVRVQGGAYAGFSSFSRQTGVFTFLSYRDPNLLPTLENYDRTADFLRHLDLSESELTKSIIGAIGSMDAYQLPDAKGYTSLLRYLIGYTDEARQKARDEILSTTARHFKEFADVLDAVKTHGQVVVLGAEDTISQANDARQNWLTVQKVL